MKKKIYKKKKSKLNKKNKSLLKIINKPILFINNKKIENKKIKINIFNKKIYFKIKKINIDKIYIKNINIYFLVNKNFKENMYIKNIINIDKFIIKLFINTNTIFYYFYLRLQDIFNLNFKYLNRKIKIFKEKQEEVKQEIKIIKLKKKNNIYIEFWDNILKNKFIFKELILWSYLKYKNLE